MTDLAEYAGLDATEARQLTDRIRGRVAELLPLIVEAYQRRAWMALGYAGWEEYCDAELRGLRLPIEDRRLVVAELQQNGMTQRQIGAALGISNATVSRDLNPSVTDVTDDGQSSGEVAMPALQDLADRIVGAIDEQVSAKQDALAPVTDLRAYVDADPEVQAIQFMRRFLDALGGAGRVVEFDAERVANLAAPHEVELLRQRAEGLNSFADKVFRARSGLRLIRGEAR